MSVRIPINRQKIAEFCRQNHIRRLSLFGSVLREDFGSDSDVDVLVEFEPGVRIGFIGLARLQLELSPIIGRRVDLRTAPELSRYFRNDVLREAEVQFASGR